MISYKRIKQRNTETGQGRTTWEYFDELDEIYGSRHAVAPPSNMLLSTFGAENAEETVADLDMEASSSMQNRNAAQPARKRRAAPNTENEILKFLKEQEEEEKIRFNNLLEAERDRIEVLKDIKNTLQSLL